MTPNEEGKFPSDYPEFTPEPDKGKWLDDLFYMLLLAFWIVASFIIAPTEVFPYILFLTAIFVFYVYRKTA